MKETVRPNLILVGTAHVSRDSVAEVERVIAEERPEIVAVELDARRLEALQNKNAWENTPIQKLLKSNRLWLFLTQSMLASYQRRLGEQLGVEPGMEMVAAIKKADEVHATVLLADRDITITMKRAWGLMTFWERTKLMFHAVRSMLGGEEGEPIDLQEMMKEDTITQMMNDLGTFAPSIKRVVIDERDEYLARMIRGPADLGKKVVAVVGAGHVQGLRRHLQGPPGATMRADDGERAKRRAQADWSRTTCLFLALLSIVAGASAWAASSEGLDRRVPFTLVSLSMGWLLGSAYLAARARKLAIQDQAYDEPAPTPEAALRALETVPVKRVPVAKILGWGLPALIVLLFVYLGWQGFQSGNFEKLQQAALYWLLLTGGCAAIGTAIARGHPYSIVTSFFMAPITTLHPLLAVGMFSGVVEATVRTPLVKDFQNLSRLKTMQDFFQNRVIRVLVVAALANVGAMIGFYLGAGKLISIFRG